MSRPKPAVPLTPEQAALAAENRRLAFRFARECGRRHGVPGDECDSEALLALCRAAAGFRPELGVKFSTYAGVAILRRLHQFATRHLRKQRRTVTLDADRGLPAGEGPSAPAEVLDALDAARRLYRPLEWRMLQLRFCEGLKFAEIGRLYQISKVRARQRVNDLLARARAKRGAA